MAMRRQRQQLLVADVTPTDAPAHLAMRRTWHKFVRLSWSGKCLLAKAAFCLLAMRLLLLLLPFTTVQRLVGKLGKRAGSANALAHPKTAAPATLNMYERLSWSIRAASARIPGTTCLPQALVAQVLLARAGCPAEFHIGVAKDSNGTFAAHAWVGAQGTVVIGGAEVTRYKPIVRTGSLQPSTPSTRSE